MNNKYYQLAVNNFAIYSETDLDGTIIRVNSYLCKISGYSEQELLGQNHRILNSGHHQKTFFEEMWHTITTGQVWRGDICNRAKNGELYWVDSMIMPILDDATGLPRKYISLRLDVTKRYNLQSQLEFQIEHDALTGLANRQHLHRRLDYELRLANDTHKQFAVCFIDLDEFKVVNDRLGHAYGDALLQQVAQRLTDEVQSNDLVVRLGGDEFVILLTQLDSIDNVTPVIERILCALSSPFNLQHHEVQISCSVGVTVYPHDRVSLGMLLRHADHALYQAKQTGRNRFVIFDVNTDVSSSAHYQLINRVTQALEQNELVLYYQPQVNLRSGQVLGFEALLRWQHPDKGLVPPLAFLPIIETSDLITDVGEWVIDQALQQLSCWQAQGYTWTISINIAAKHFQQPNFVERLQYMLERYPHVPAQRLNFEVLESVALEDMRHMQSIIAASQALGVRFSLDDFGVGYSSLNHLKQLHTEEIKIDRSFVQNMLNDKDDLALTQAVISLSRVFNRQVVAEGLELPEQGVLLMRLGCDIAQGFFMAKPMPVTEVIPWANHFTPHPSWNKWAQVKWSIDDFSLLLAQYDHKQHVLRIIKSVEQGCQALESVQATDHLHCQFGQWYANHGALRYGNLPAFSAIGEQHVLAHQLEATIIKLCQAGQLESARTVCTELEATMNSIIETADSLVKSLQI